MRAETVGKITRLFAIAAIVGGIAIGGVASSAQTVSERETARSVQRALERLPYYGVFDFLAFNVERGVVTLTGYAYHGSLRHSAEIVTCTGSRPAAAWHRRRDHQCPLPAELRQRSPSGLCRP